MVRLKKLLFIMSMALWVFHLYFERRGSRIKKKKKKGLLLKGAVVELVRTFICSVQAATTFTIAVDQGSELVICYLRAFQLALAIQGGVYVGAEEPKTLRTQVLNYREQLNAKIFFLICLLSLDMH